MITTIMTSGLLQPLLVAVFVGAAASLLGSFAILKRMALVGDAMTHVALPGMALALLFNLNPFWGALVFLAAATLGIWLLEKHSGLSVETLVGILFSTSLAIGVILTPNQDLLEALFGNITALNWTEAIVSIFVSLGLIILILAIKRRLVLNMLSAELAQSVGINNRQLELIYLLIFAVAVALGIKFVGALLMGSLVIIPAAAAKNVAKGFNGFLIASMAFGILSSAISIFIWHQLNIQPGPVFILVGASIFLLTLFYRWLKS